MIQVAEAERTLLVRQQKKQVPEMLSAPSQMFCSGGELRCSSGLRTEERPEPYSWKHTEGSGGAAAGPNVKQTPMEPAETHCWEKEANNPEELKRSDQEEINTLP